jgi:hypothetical protein
MTNRLPLKRKVRAIYGLNPNSRDFLKLVKEIEEFIERLNSQIQMENGQNKRNALIYKRERLNQAFTRACIG